MSDSSLGFPRLLTACNAPLSSLERLILQESVAIESWFTAQWRKTPAPLTSSVDLRQAGFKIAPVDTNLFPAGFNNLQEELWPLCAQALREVLLTLQPKCQRILLLPESHTRNEYYLQSLSVLQNRLKDAGFVVRVGSLDPTLTQEINYKLPNGSVLCLEPLKRQGNRIELVNFDPCVVILNHDLSTGIPKILEGVAQPIHPPAALGWSTRFKSSHFSLYELVVNEFAKVFGIDPWLLNPLFSMAHDIDFMQQEGLENLAAEVDKVLQQITLKYQAYGIHEPPFVIVKADNGTYGMSVMTVHTGLELLQLNRKQRTRMSASKGRQVVRRVLIQEGIYSVERLAENSVAEPVMYLIGPFVVGGFYRAHVNRLANESLNTPGMHFQALPIDSQSLEAYSQVRQPLQENRFYVYSVIARLAALAAGREMAELV